LLKLRRPHRCARLAQRFLGTDAPRALSLPLALRRGERGLSRRQARLHSGARL
jgi:hypothetical protein